MQHACGRPCRFHVFLLLPASVPVPHTWCAQGRRVPMHVNGCTSQQCKSKGQHAGAPACKGPPPARARGAHQWTFNPDSTFAICNGMSVCVFGSAFFIFDFPGCAKRNDDAELVSPCPGPFLQAPTPLATVQLHQRARSKCGVLLAPPAPQSQFLQLLQNPQPNMLVHFRLLFSLSQPQLYTGSCRPSAKRPRRKCPPCGTRRGRGIWFPCCG